jgi:hypothetical protein
MCNISVIHSILLLFQEELLDLVVLPFLGNIADDQDVTVRTSAVQLLLDLSQTCDSSKCTDILNIIEKVHLTMKSLLLMYVYCINHNGCGITKGNQVGNSILLPWAPFLKIPQILTNQLTDRLTNQPTDRLTI